MRRIVGVMVVVAGLSWAGAAAAQSAPPYMTVDAVTTYPDRIEVAGVLQGEATPTTRVLRFSTSPTAGQVAQREECARLLLLALSKPGQYLIRFGAPECSVAVARP